MGAGFSVIFLQAYLRIIVTFLGRAKFSGSSASFWPFGNTLPFASICNFSVDKFLEFGILSSSFIIGGHFERPYKLAYEDCCCHSNH